MASAAMLGSILPGAWSFMLAARERGLGTAWTTIHLMFEEQAAEILGIDFQSYTQCALITCGYSKGTDFNLQKDLHWRLFFIGTIGMERRHEQCNTRRDSNDLY